MESREGEVTTSGGSIVAYHDWILSGQPNNWGESEILKQIRDYNEVDCVSTLKLAQWLRDVQTSHGIEFVQGETSTVSLEPGVPRKSYNDDAVILADRLIESASTRWKMANESCNCSMLGCWNTTGERLALFSGASIPWLK